MTKDQMLAIIEAIKTGHLDYITELFNDNTDWLLTRLVDEDGYKLLPVHYASRYGQLDILQLLLEKKPDLLNSTDDFSDTLVHFAAVNGHPLVVDYLAKKGADLSITTNAPDMECHEYLPIHWATRRGHHTVVQCLINHGADINMRLGMMQYHLIHFASMDGQLEVVKILLNKDPDLLNITDAYGQTPVLWAAASNHEALVDYLATMGADLTISTNHPDHGDHGYLPIHWAAKRGYHTVVQCLINHGADINMRLGEMQYHLIHIASKAGQLEVVKILLNKDPDLLNINDTYGQTPVLWAAARNHEALVDYLATMGADLSIATNRPDHGDHGYLPIHWAAKRGYHTLVQCLINHGADINMRLGEMQYHLIHIASMAGHLEVVKILLNKNPDLLNITDAYHQTPVLWAAANGHAHVVAYFISENANLDIATNRPEHIDHDKTPLTRAMEGKHYGAANLLILKVTANQSKDIILPFVQAGTQALELMILDPALIHIFLQDHRVLRLIMNTSGCHISSQSIDWYKAAGRRPSLFAHINTETGGVSVFKPVRELGKGSNGIVRLFQNAESQEIGVKSLKDSIVDISSEQRDARARKLKREAEFNKLAYPNDQMSKIFEFNYISGDQRFYTNRYLMPYIKGEVAKLFIPKITCPHQLAEITLQIARELHRIHNIGIIHGDLSPSNMMIYCENKKFIIRLIDFGCSSYLTDRSAYIFKADGSIKWYAPEVVGTTNSIKPNQNQDVYSLGFSLNMVLDRHSSNQELMKLFPSIGLFISAAQNINPMARPSLESFCAQLSNEINPETQSDISPMMGVENSTKITTSALITHHFVTNSKKETSSENPLAQYRDEPPIQKKGFCIIS